MDRYVIPGKLDEPERIGLWTMDEFIAMAGPFVIGILAQHILFGIMFGTLGWWVLRKAKAGRAGSWLLHMAYWHLPPGVTGVRTVPPSHLRLMAG
jgi:conjugal transfer pilus assembly protein TraL